LLFTTIATTYIYTLSLHDALPISLKFIPKKIARNFVDNIEHRLSDSNFKHKSRLPIERMQAFGRSRHGFTHVVFGHFHEKLVLEDRKSTRLNSSHLGISYAVFCLK